MKCHSTCSNVASWSSAANYANLQFAARKFPGQLVVAKQSEQKSRVHSWIISSLYLQLAQEF
uniref:Uncharacterized protein n=1 Tax=Nelumbo nucifera TaxID=4432 RepID=A0A822YM18_NELNU|nr:TPA_asm: hypothetical protein HUJ06_012491 [Nelumbo nucifera]